MEAYSIGGGEIMPTLISSQFKGPSNTNDGTMVAVCTAKGEDVMATLSADDITQRGQGYVNNSLCETFIEDGDARTQEAAVCYEHHPQDSRIKRTEVAPTCGTFGNSIEGKDCLVQDKIEEGVTYSVDQGGGKSSCSAHREVAPTTTTHQGEPVVNQYHYAVRRITPIEGERLQGFTDGWTRPCFTPEQITDELVDQFVGIHKNWSVINGKPNAKPKTREWVRKWLMTISSAECPDGPRYKAIGNSMSVNVMNWIGQQIQEQDKKGKVAK